MSEVLWVVRDASGAEISRSEVFPTVEEAEEWMGAHWSELRSAGGVTVALMEDGELRYEMGLSES